ncbi:MAG: repeat protein, partial [Phycisphaerales bacterium]|nr:repeat protein [Phycisphaerales bacterium]
MTRLNRSLLTAAIATVFASGVFAQTRVDTRGATDANNRVGSNGQNTSAGGRTAPWDIANNLVYGNITAGKAFRGSIASGDPQAFRGRSASANLDNFVRSSSGVTTGGVTSYNANQTRAFYGDSRNVPPPAGTVGISTTGGYSPPVPTAWKSVDPR